MSEQVAVARAIAHIVHRGQTDKAGNPYIGHPARVVARLEGEPERVIAAAWLHDALEDSDLSGEDLQQAGVDLSVVITVATLTRTKGVPAEEYYETVRGHTPARKVKLADIADNTDPARLALLDDATIVRLTKKYAKARTLLGVVSD